MFSTKDVAEYYNTTINHYERWWNLRNNLSLHYGIWDENTKTFADSLVNTNRVLAELSDITEQDNVLDAGCGVGGAALYLAQTQNTSVTGISLSQKQVNYANNSAKKHGVAHKVSFQVMDYTQTSFKDESFDVVWACESVSSATDKAAFIKEAYRMLKKGGRLILSDFFLANEHQKDPHNWIRKWLETWSMNNIVTTEYFTTELTKVGFQLKENLDYTTKIRKSAHRLYYASILGWLPSETYNLFHPKVSRFAKTHYRSGYYQWKGLKSNLWKYVILLATKQP